MARWVALLRGINVGGKNLIGMPALKAWFEGQGLADVQTYIQSGNVVFTSGAGAAALVASLEAGLSKAFGHEASVFLRSARQLRAIVDGAPQGFGTRPERYRYDVIFLRKPLSPATALARAPVKPSVDEVHAGPDVLYFSRLVLKASQSRMSRITALPIYRQMTIRNWNTTTRLLALLEARSLTPPGR
jgi:uncharacterized protein (DUF1697 family)